MKTSKHLHNKGNEGDLDKMGQNICKSYIAVKVSNQRLQGILITQYKTKQNKPK